jgi:hypothetical protein
MITKTSQRTQVLPARACPNSAIHEPETRKSPGCPGLLLLRDDAFLLVTVETIVLDLPQRALLGDSAEDAGQPGRRALTQERDVSDNIDPLTF